MPPDEEPLGRWDSSGTWRFRPFPWCASNASDSRDHRGYEASSSLRPFRSPGHEVAVVLECVVYWSTRRQPSEAAWSDRVRTQRWLLWPPKLQCWSSPIWEVWPFWHSG